MFLEFLSEMPSLCPSPAAHLGAPASLKERDKEERLQPRRPALSPAGRPLRHCPHWHRARPRCAGEGVLRDVARGGLLAWDRGSMEKWDPGLDGAPSNILKLWREGATIQDLEGHGPPPAGRSSHTPVTRWPPLPKGGRGWAQESRWDRPPEGPAAATGRALRAEGEAGRQSSPRKTPPCTPRPLTAGLLRAPG